MHWCRPQYMSICTSREDQNQHSMRAISKESEESPWSRVSEPTVSAPSIQGWSQSSCTDNRFETSRSIRKRSTLLAAFSGVSVRIYEENRDVPVGLSSLGSKAQLTVRRSMTLSLNVKICLSLYGYFPDNLHSNAVRIAR